MSYDEELTADAKKSIATLLTINNRELLKKEGKSFNAVEAAFRERKILGEYSDAIIQLMSTDWLEHEIYKNMIYHSITCKKDKLIDIQKANQGRSFFDGKLSYSDFNSLKSQRLFYAARAFIALAYYFDEIERNTQKLEIPEDD